MKQLFALSTSLSMSDLIAQSFQSTDPVSFRDPVTVFKNKTQSPQDAENRPKIHA